MSRRVGRPSLLLMACGVAVIGCGGHRMERVASRQRSNVPSFVSTVPLETPPPGRPFSREGVIYADGAPTLDALRASMKGANVLIVVLDAARADRFGCYGYPRQTTPIIDRIAEESLLFEQHFTQASVTGPSTTSLLTSQYPDTHGILDNYESGSIIIDWPSSLPTVEKTLAARGFLTFLCSSNAVASPEFGMCTDFQHQWYPGSKGFPDAMNPVRFTLQGFPRLYEALTLRPGARFFAYVHIMPPHEPYAAPEELVRPFLETPPPHQWETPLQFTGAVDVGGMPQGATRRFWPALYEANLRWADACVGELLSSLEKVGLADKTLLVISADHGEGMREHGFMRHIPCPYDEALHIPLLIRLPGKHPPVGRVKALTQTIDVVPTVLDLLGLARAATSVQGRSLVPLLTGETDKVNDFAFSRTAGKKAWYIVRDAHTTLLHHNTGQWKALYDMDSDPWQTKNIVDQQPAREAAVMAAYDRFAKSQKYAPDLSDPKREVRQPDLPKREMSEETKRKLESLGYLK